jgi:hypothetical protein
VRFLPQHRHGPCPRETRKTHAVPARDPLGYNWRLLPNFQRSEARGARVRFLLLFGSLVVAAVAIAQTQKSSDVAAFVTVDTPVFVLDHVRVIDGTGAATKEDQAIVIANGKIDSIGPAGSAQVPHGAQLLDRSGYTVIRIRSPYKLPTEELPSRGCSSRKSLTQRRACI